MKEVLTPLDAFREEVPTDALLEWMQALDIHDERLDRYARFHPERYVRNLVQAGPAYHALLLCWRAGQRSPIHDHVGSACAVKVIRGVATETLFERGDNGMVYATESITHREGDVCVSHDSDVHQISNLQADGLDLITMHIYSPPLISMNRYSLFDSEVTHFVDPINSEFVAGAGI